MKLNFTKTKHSKVVISFWAVCMLLLTMSTITEAATYFSTAGGTQNPNTLTFWKTVRDGTGSSPANFSSGDIFVVQGSGNGGTTPHLITTNTNWTISGTNSKLQIENGASLTSTNQITLNSNTTFQIDNGGTYVHNNIGTPSTSIFGGTESFGASSTVSINQWTSNNTLIITGVTLPFGNLTINNSSFATNWNQSWTGSINLCAGNLTVTTTGGGELRFTGTGTTTVTVAGNYSQAANTVNLASGNGAAVTFNVGGNFTLTNGLFYVASSNNSANSVTVTGNTVVSSTGTNGIYLASGGNGGTLGTFQTTDFTSNGTSSSMVDFGSSGTGHQFRIRGNFSKSGSGTFWTTSSSAIGNFVFNKAGTQTFSYSGATTQYTNYIVNSGSTLQMLTGLTLGTATNPLSSVTVNSGATLDMGTQVITGANNTDPQFTLSSGAKIITANATGVQGSVTNIGAADLFLNSGANYEFQGAATGVFTTTPTANTVNNLIINRASGVTLSQNIAVAGTLDFQNGLVDPSSFNLTINAAGTISGASSTKYVTGKLLRIYSATGSKNFPVGKGGVYRPLDFNYTALTGTSTVSVNQIESALTGTLPANTNLNNSRTWDISQTGGSAFTYKVTLDATGDVVSGTVVMLKKESGTITSNAATAPNYTNTTGFTTLTGTNNFTTGSTCTVSANAGSDQTNNATCGLTTVTLGGNTPTFGTGAWSVVSGAGGSFVSTSNPTTDFSGTAGTAYNLQWTITNGNCSSNDQVLVTLNRNPTTSNAGPDQTGAATCGLTSVTLAGNAPSVGTGQWSIISGSGGSFTGGAGNPTNSNSNAATFNGVSGNTYTLRWTISNSPCTASFDDVVITLNTSPTTANAGPDQTSIATCGLTTVTLAANTPTVGTGQWSIVSGAGGSFTGGTGNPTNSSIVNPTFSGVAGTAYVLRWTISNAPCTASTDDVNVTFNQDPTISNAGPDQTSAATCGLTTVTMAANAPSIGTGAWTIISGVGGSFSNASSETSDFIGTAGTSYVLRWTISNSPCASSTDDVDVTFNQDPTVSNAGPDQTNAATCGLTTVTMAANAAAIGTGAWTIISGVGGSFANPASETSTFSGTAGVTYTLRWSISTICNTSTDDVDVTFNQNPTVSDAGPDQDDILTCGLTTVTLAGNTPSIGIGTWSIISGAGGSFVSASNPTTDFSGTAGVTYVLRWTIANAPCTDSQDDVTITFNESPTTSVAGSNQSFCLGDVATLAANTPTIGTAVWSIVSGPSSNLSQFSSTTNPAATFTPDGGLGNYVLQWTISNAPCNASSSNLNVVVTAGPWIGNISTDWTDPLNWCGGVPISTTDVVIDNGATFYPVITTGAQVANSITIIGGSLTIDGGSLNGGDIVNDGTLTVGVGGTLNMVSNQISGTGTVNVNGTLETSKAAGLSGTASTTISNTISSFNLGSASTIDYTSGGSQTITSKNYANINNTGNGDRILSSSGVIGISGAFSPGSGDYTVTGSNVEFNGSLAQTIPALAPASEYNNLEINNSAGVSMVADLNLIDAITLTDGAFTTTGFTFTLLSTSTQTARIAPITGGSIVGDVNMQRFVPGGLAGWATIGMPVGGRTLADWDDDIITSGFTGSSTGSGTFVNIYTYDESVAGNADAAAAYIPATNITNSVNPKAGYYVFIADNATTVADKNIDVKGPPLTGSQDLNVTFTANTNADEDGWNLVNNPYCSAIDWTNGAWTKTNMDDAIYIYDADNLQYTGYVNGVSFNGGNEIIGSSQAFLVHAFAAAPSLIAEEAVKDASSPNFYKSASSATVAGMLRLQLDGLNGTYRDETILRTKAGATVNFDPAYDAYKLYSFDAGAPNISTKVNGVEYVVNSIEELSTNMDIPVKVNVTTPGSYTINFVGLNDFASLDCFTFEDKLTATSIDLKVDSFYTFTSAIDTAAAYNRFVLHIGAEPVVAAATPSSTLLSIPGNETVSFTNTSTGATAYAWDFGDGSAIDTAFNASHTYTTPGTYTVSLTVSNSVGCDGPKTITVTITVDDVTSVSNNTLAESINISRDAQGVFANYNFKNNTKVKVNIYNTLGALVSSPQQESVQNKGKFLIPTTDLAKGLYSIELLYDNKKLIKKMDF
jgi:PKD domain